MLERQLLTSPFIPVVDLAAIVELSRLCRRACSAPTKLTTLEQVVLHLKPDGAERLSGFRRSWPAP